MWTCRKCGIENRDAVNCRPECGAKKASVGKKRRKLYYWPALIVGCVLVMLTLGGWSFKKPSSAAGEAEIVDVVRLLDERKGEALVALRADGTLRTVGLEKWFGKDVVRQIESWTDLVQIETYFDTDLFGLKADGRVVSTYRPAYPDSSDPNTWTNVKRLVIGNIDYYAVTRDGRVLIPETSPTQSLNRNIMNWTDVADLAYFSYPEARGVIALRSDGTVLLPSEYYPFTDPPKGAVAVESSGFIHCCVQKDGRVKIAGLESTYNQELVEDAARITDAVQTVAYSRGLACRLRDGTVVSCGRIPDNTGKWKKVVDIQDSAAGLLGLTKKGTILFSTLNEGFPRADPVLAQKLEREMSSWKDIERIKSYGDYVLGWQSDGTLLAAGIDLSVFR